MVTVYFDRNVFADICELRNGLTERDVLKLTRAVESGVINIPASATIFEETVSILRESETKYDQHIKTVLNLVDKRRMVKETKDLLLDDCYYFTVGLPDKVRTMKTPHEVREFLDVSKNKADLLEMAEDIAHFFTGSAERLTESLLEARGIGERKGVVAQSQERVSDLL
jgi:hypothetical protein